MQCPGCKAEVADGKFCSNCGAPLAAKCASCGTENAPGAKFCSECGTNLSGAPAVSQAAPPPPAPEPARRPETHIAQDAERRQLSVMFCDLVGSTALSTEMDPEDLRDVLALYQDSCKAEIARYGGFIARYMGDGILVYFGYPQAHEDDAERGVHAGLGIIEAVSALKPRPGLSLQVRVGLATGLVVAGDIVGEGASEERAVLGETPNLAARLQSLAEPDTIVISPATKRLTGGAFAYADLGEHELKGIAAPVRAWRVIGEGAADSRFEAAHGAGSGTLVGRDEELGLMTSRWEQAKEGEGQVVLLSGEAGIGKSRIVQALRDHFAGEERYELRFQCSPYHTSSFLYPIIGEVTRSARIAPDMTPDEKLDRVEAVFTAGKEPVEKVAPLIAGILSIPTGDRYPPLNLTPQAQKDRTIEALANQVVGLAASRPVAFILEDLQWTDPTTLETLDMIIDLMRDARVLMLLTFRPEFEPRWGHQSQVTMHSLNRLSRRRGAAMIEHLTGGKPLPEEVMAQIVAKTDGVPLFVEELTKTVLESGLVVETEDRYVLAGPLTPLAIPETLHDSLMARLDRLAPVKEVAQLGAALGRTFTYELAAAASDLADNQLQDALVQLTGAEIVFSKGAPPDATYTFKHALVQDAAYGSMLKSTRQQLHTRIVTALESDFPAMVESEPDVLAQHCDAAGLADKAVGYWQRSGQASVERSTMKEAIAQIESGLAAAATIEDEDQRLRAELDLRAILVFPFRTTKGLGSDEVGENFTRVSELSRQTEDTRHLLSAMYGQFAFTWARGDMAETRARAEDLMAHAREADDLTSRLAARYALGLVQLFQSEVAASEENLRQVIDDYDPARHAPLAFAYATEFGTAAHNFLAMGLGFAGRYDESIAAVEGAITLAERLGHPFPIAHAYSVGAVTVGLFGNTEMAKKWGAEGARVSEEQGFGPYLAIGVIAHEWAAAVGEKDASAGERLLNAVDDWRAMSYGVAGGAWQGFHAEALLAHGEAGEARVVIDNAIETIRAGGEVLFLGFALNVRGDVFLALSDVMAAKAGYEEALETANRLGLFGQALRAAACLAELTHRDGNEDEARALLAPALDAVVPSDASPEYVRAKSLLESLDAA